VRGFGTLMGMTTILNTPVLTGISTDAKFWCYLTPFLFGSAAVWSYLGWWLLCETPAVVSGLVSGLMFCCNGFR
jgi:hypothetical protein